MPPKQIKKDINNKENNKEKEVIDDSDNSTDSSEEEEEEEEEVEEEEQEQEGGESNKKEDDEEGGEEDGEEEDPDDEEEWNEEEEEGGEEEEADIEGIGDAETGTENIGDDDDCMYDTVKKRSKKMGHMDRLDDDEGEDIDVDENELNPELYVKPEDMRTKRILTKFERVRILGDRTTQLAQGAKPMIKGVEGMDPRTVAQLEFEAKMIPIKIIRPLPNGKKEILSLKDLEYRKSYIIYGFTGGIVDRKKIN